MLSAEKRTPPDLLQAAVTRDEGFKASVNTYAGKLTYEAVALSQNRVYTPLDQLL